MTRLLYRLGRGSAAHPWRVLAGWLLVAATVFSLAGTVGGPTQEDWDVPGARAQHGIDLLRQHLPGAGNATARVVLHGERAFAGDDLTALGDRLAAMPHAVTVSDPRLSADGDTAILEVGYDVPVTDHDLFGKRDALDRAIAPLEDAGYQVELNGDVPENAAAPMQGRGELIGIIAALLILLFAFGSVVSAGLPIGSALVGLGIGAGGLTILAGLTNVSTMAPTVATMVGLGVGIDYALLLVTRHAEFLHAGFTPVEAAGRATATAGRSVVFAAGTVLVSLMGLRLAGLSTYSTFGFATAIAVVGVAAASLTVVPVLCRLAGRRVLPRGVRRQRTRDREPFTARWAARVGRRPLPWAVGAVLVMVALALPALDLHTWPGDPGDQSRSLTTRRAHDLIASEFGVGANTDYTVVAGPSVSERAVDQAHAAVARIPGVVEVGAVTASPDGALHVFRVVPRFGDSDSRTSQLVADIRAGLPDGVELTGRTPYFSDITAMLGERLWIVIGFVVTVSMLLLAMVFRSVLLPVKAAVMNLLSVAAAYGVMVAVFQWGWGGGILGVDHAFPVSAWMPVLVFAVLFGLSMDYEVFLLSRVRERWLDSGDPRSSVVAGLSDTGRVISAAAAIMVAVFLGFASEVDWTVKQLGIGMAVAVLLDATLVRMVLVPATMSLLGRWNWWLPAWLDRLLPTVSVEDDAAELDEPVRA
ncbi:MMPL family transporter [Nocardioides sp. AN3]